MAPVDQVDLTSGLGNPNQVTVVQEEGQGSGCHPEDTEKGEAED